MQQVKNAVMSATIASIAAAAIALPGAVNAQEIYVHGGTLGAGVGGALSLNAWSGVHAEIEGFGLSHSFDVDGNRYDGHLKLLQGGAYLDLFPFVSSGFRVTAGALINDNRLSAQAQPNAQGEFKIGDDFVPAVGPAPSATATLPRVMPYLGIGYGHKPASKGFGLTFDLGVAYGRPRTTYNVPAIYSMLTSQANIDQEEQNISNKLSRYKLYPAVQIGLSYRF
ncbi:hypothetical protein SAMN05443245_3938 [Paraburkholderia fungorum]|uniref:Outer membrane protein beta-barrel domain-containing protein n=1 Tax=Paraburkholderia fungorum TaxID=134537 RepID=A0A1H1HI75_9BURK|nr:hypothetical protein [Paraburkholderia fungorum]SDR25123.1 hypothetical protein SAMN05443245_3938 [Paraburkholderia fungorum]